MNSRIAPPRRGGGGWKPLNWLGPPYVWLRPLPRVLLRLPVLRCTLLRVLPLLRILPLRLPVLPLRRPLLPLRLLRRRQYAGRRGGPVLGTAAVPVRGAHVSLPLLVSVGSPGLLPIGSSQGEPARDYSRPMSLKRRLLPAALLVSLTVPFVALGTLPAQAADDQITAYAAEATLTGDGVLKVKETVDLTAGGDTLRPDAGHPGPVGRRRDRTYDISNVSATVNGQPAEDFRTRPSTTAGGSV